MVRELPADLVGQPAGVVQPSGRPDTPQRRPAEVEPGRELVQLGHQPVETCEMPDGALRDGPGPKRRPTRRPPDTERPAQLRVDLPYEPPGGVRIVRLRGDPRRQQDAGADLSRLGASISPGQWSVQAALRPWLGGTST